MRSIHKGLCDIMLGHQSEKNEFYILFERIIMSLKEIQGCLDDSSDVDILVSLNFKSKKFLSHKRSLLQISRILQPTTPGKRLKYRK